MPEQKPSEESGTTPQSGSSHETAPSSPGRERLRAGFWGKPSRAQLVVAVLLAAVGFAAMTQVQNNERDDDYTGLRQADLIRVFDGLSASSQRAENEIDRLTELRNDLRDESSKREAALEEAREDTDVYAILAGTAPATGPGVRITITDDLGQVDANTLLDAIQELRAAGAEVMEFNDRVRVVASSAIEQTSAGIELDGELLEAPFVIDVIGEPTTLAGALDFPDGPKEAVEEVGGDVSVEELESVDVVSVVKEPEGDFAEPRDDQ